MRVEIWVDCNIRKTHIRISIKKKTYQSKIQNQIEKEIPLSLARSLYIYIYTKHSQSISFSWSVPISPSK